jgi:hypothetical protein
MKEQLRLNRSAKQDDDEDVEPSGEVGYSRLTDVIGTYDRDLTEALDAWMQHDAPNGSQQRSCGGVTTARIAS